MDNLRISKTVVPKNQPSRQEWVNEFRFGSMYVEPYRYFQNNHFDTEVYHKSSQTANRSILSGISKLFNLLSWVA